MKKERKMLISIVLVLVMLLNCIMPLVVSFADDEVEEPTPTEVTFEDLDDTLYKALKSALEKQSKKFTYDNINHRITVTADVASSITALNLESTGISDLTGLEKLASFPALENLDLSGNSLTKDSNLTALSGLTNLKWLDLSTNQLEDISSINDLINAIEANGGQIDITSQTVTKVIESEYNGDDPYVTIDLPQIFEKLGFLKSDWYKENQKLIRTSSVTNTNFVSEVTFNGDIATKIKLSTSQNGLYYLKIYVEDSLAERRRPDNVNPSSENALEGSIFNFYVAVHGEDQSIVYMPDNNLYDAIKEQLTKGQRINPDLLSYPYKVGADGMPLSNVYREYTTSGHTFLINTATHGSDVSVSTYTNDSYILQDGRVCKYTYSSSSGGTYRVSTFVTNEYEETTYVASDGTHYRAYKIALSETDSRNLYEAAYDEAKILVISKEDLVNEITSLILNNKRIYDLTGIEKFIGLKSNLNVSHNSISNIEPIFNLQTNKRDYTATLQADYMNWLNVRDRGNLNSALTEVKTNKEAINEEIAKISEAQNTILEKIVEAKDISQTNADGTDNANYDSQIQAIIDDINKTLKTIYGEDVVDTVTGRTTHNDGFIEVLDDKIDAIFSSRNGDMPDIYEYLKELYNAYHDEYKLTTLLTPELNYLNAEEYDTYKTSLQNSPKDLLSAEYSRIVELAENDALSYFERLALLSKYTTLVSGNRQYTDLDGVTYKVSDFTRAFTWKDTDGNPYTANEIIAKIFSEFDNEMTLSNAREEIADLRKIALYSEMVNYCWMERMNESGLASDTCYCEKFLQERIQDFELEGLDTTLEKSIMDKTDSMYSIYTTYKGITIPYYNATTENYDISEGLVWKVDGMKRTEPQAKEKWKDLLESSLQTDAEIIKVIDGIDKGPLIDFQLYDKHGSKYCDYDNDHLFLYNEYIALATKLTLASDEVSHYVVLPSIKSLDISYNNYLGLEGIEQLTGLRALYANHNMIDIDDVDWTNENFKYLRKLGLNNNWIDSLKVLENLQKLEELDVSHNLLEGKLDFDLTQTQETLKEFNLSYNQLDDIETILKYLDVKVGRNYGDFLAREDTLNIDLGYQELEMTANVVRDDGENEKNINLPKIFAQLLSIDTGRTAFQGSLLPYVSVESSGKFATVETRANRSYEATVDVIAMSGSDPNVDTCVGKGTRVTIKYNVGQVTDIDIVDTKGNVITDTTVDVGRDEQKQFSTKITTINLDQTATWEIFGEHKPGTMITNDGLLTVAADEELRPITIRATSTADTSKYAEVTVNVVETTDEYEVKISTEGLKTRPVEGEDDQVEYLVPLGETHSFAATVKINGEEKPEEGVIWKVEGQEVNTTTIDENGLLTVSNKEDIGRKLTITATSKTNSQASDTLTITIVQPKDYVITINEEDITTVTIGRQQQFTATVKVNGEVSEEETVTWKIEGTTKSAINDAGILFVGSDEVEGTVIKVIATSVSSPEVFAEKEVTVALPREVTSVVINDPAETVKVDTTQTFTATVVGTDNLTEEEKQVKWSVTGNTSNLTSIDETTGELKVALNEIENTILTVTATSTFDETKMASVEVKVVGENSPVTPPPVDPDHPADPEIESVTITPGNASIAKGESQNFEATVQMKDNATLPADTEFEWKITGAITDTENTKLVVSQDGKTATVTVGPNETATSLVLELTIKYGETTRTERRTIAITNATVENLEHNVQYTIDGDYLIGVAPKMPVANFKNEFVPNLDTSRYEVVVTSEDGDTSTEVTSGYMKTGMYVKVIDKVTRQAVEVSESLAYQIIVTGDINADGLANDRDWTLLKAIINEVRITTDIPQELMVKAADINHSGRVDRTDSKLLLYHRAEVTGYDLNYKASN